MSGANKAVGIYVYMLLLTCSGKVIRLETDEVFSYRYLIDYGFSVENKTGISFSLRAKNDAHIALSRYKHNWDFESYEIVIGGWNNQRSVIRKCDQCRPQLTVANSPLNETDFRQFWITWDNSTLRTGYGSKRYSREFMSWKDPDSHQVNYVGVSTGWKAMGVWVFNYVDGGWSEWNEWEECSVSCGGGRRIRRRACNNPAPEYGGYCDGPPELTETCGRKECPVDGDWSTWDAWSRCSQSCASGLMTRTRNCDSPAPQFGGSDCLGQGTESIGCQDVECPVDGRWATWASWGRCSRSCGPGTMVRRRLCDDPTPQFGGDPCPENSTEDSDCLDVECPVDGGWTPWTSWSSCSRSCGAGAASRTRSCDNPPTQFGGSHCSGEDAENIHCLDMECPVDGEWSEWASWTTCTQTCGGGKQYRDRKCNNPTPQYDGLYCDGVDFEEEVCSSGSCPVAGGWSQWVAWSRCSHTCGPGSRTRQRTCDSPAPAHNGAPCQGKSSSSEACFDRPCPVVGGWGPWAEWSACSVTCGPGNRTRLRLCDDPAPAHGGPECEGRAEDTEACYVRPCAMDGVWSAWTAWSSCTRTCGTGTTTRRRHCNNPSPANGGRYCPGSDQQSEKCSIEPCPADGSWSAWGDWTPCSAICGMGFTMRQRACDNPVPSHGGEFCFGEAVESSECFIMYCAINGSWSSWSQWSTCSVWCGGGVRSKLRLCTDPEPRYGGAFCRGTAYRNGTCGTTRCPVDGQWSMWSGWSDCSMPCGVGYTLRTRACDSPPPESGGFNCTGADEHNRTCNFELCKRKKVVRVSRETPEEAPGAEGIGFIGLSFIFALLATFLVLDLMTLPRHLRFMRNNLRHGYRRFCGEGHATGRRRRREPSRDSSIMSDEDNAHVFPEEKENDYIRATPDEADDSPAINASSDDIDIKIGNESFASIGNLNRQGSRNIEVEVRIKAVRDNTLMNLPVPQNDLNKDKAFNTIARQLRESQYQQALEGLPNLELSATKL